MGRFSLWCIPVLLACGGDGDAQTSGPGVDPGTTSDSSPSPDASPSAESGTTSSGPVEAESSSEGGGADESTGTPPVQPPPAECGESEFLDVVNLLGAGEAMELSTLGLTDELMDAGAGHWITQYTFKAVFDPTWCRVLFTGGGHASFVKFVSYDVATNTWQREANPNWWCDPFTADNYWPCVGHAYGHNALDAEGGAYYYKNKGTGTVQRLELEGVLGSEWTTLPEIGSDPHYTSIDYFPEIGGLVLVDYTVGPDIGDIRVLYDGATSWETVADSFAMGEYHIYSVYSSGASAIMFGSGNGSTDWHVFRDDLSVQTVSNSPRGFHPQPGDDTTFRILTADPVGGDFLAASQGGALYQLDLDANEWSDTGTTLPPGLELAVQIPDYGAVMFISGVDNRVVVYRHS